MASLRFPTHAIIQTPAQALSRTITYTPVYELLISQFMLPAQALAHDITHTITRV